MRLPLSVLLGLAGTLLFANLALPLAADADADRADAAPSELPEGAALTGDAARPTAQVHGLDIGLTRDDDGLRLTVVNPSDRARTVKLRGSPSHSSGSAMSRMGPMLTQFEPQIITMIVPAGQRTEWELETVLGDQVPVGFAPDLVVDSTPVVDLTPAREPSDPEGLTTASGERVMLNRINVGGMLSFSTWTLDLQIEEDGEVDRAILNLQAG